jgi:hypothetical protein
MNIPDGKAGEFMITKFAAYESEAARRRWRLRLPDLGFGYDSVDMLILCTSTKKFLKGWRTSRPPGGSRPSL